MLHLIPAPLHRTGLRLAHAVRRRWWRIASPRLAGCRVIALDPDGRVLLIRHTYGHDLWMPPGGGLGRGEEPIAAAVRELREETGCTLAEARMVTFVEEDLHGAGNRVHIIGGWTDDCPQADSREVIAASFFAIDALPEHMPPRLRGQLPEWVRAVTAGRLPDAAFPPSRPPAKKA